MARSWTSFRNAKARLFLCSLVLAAPLAAQSDNALTFLPSSIKISVQQGHVPLPQDIQVVATKRNVNYSVTFQSVPPGLFSIAGQSFATPGKFTVFFGTAAAGHYEGKITITAAATDVSNPVTDIPVVIDITTLPALSVSPNPVALTVLKDAASSTQAVTVSTNGDPIAFTASATGASGAVTWLTIAQSTNVTGTQNNVTLNIAPAGLAPGSYTGSLTITPSNTTTSTVVPINLTVAAAAQLTVDPPSLAFIYQTGQTAPAAQTVNVSNASGSQLPYTTTVSTPNTTANWLKVAAGGTAPGPLTINVDPTGLNAGTYAGSITLTATGISSLTATIQVQLTVSNTPLLTVTPASLAFQTPSNANPQPKQVTVYTTSGALSYAVQLQQGTDWIFLIPGNVATPQGSAITVAPNTISKAAGTYNSKLVITAPAGAAIPTQTIEVPIVGTVTQVATLTSNPAQATLDVPPGTTAFQKKDLTISISDTTSTQFTVSVSPDSARSWLFTTISTGTVSSTSPVALSILVNPTVLTANRTDAEVVVTPASGSTAQPLRIPVSVRITGQVTFSMTPAGAVSFTADPRSAVQTKTVHVTSDPPSTDFIAQVQNADWLQASPAVGNTGASGTDLAVRVDPGTLTAGVYNGTINVIPVSATTTTPFQISVKLTVGTPAAITVSPANLTFNYSRGQAVPPQQAISVASGSTVTTFAVTSSTNNGNTSWLIPVVTTTTTPATVGVKVDPSGLAPGTYTGSVVVTGQGTSNGPQTIGVTLLVQDLPTPVITDIQNGASFQSTAAAPGLIITIRGSNLGPTTGVAAQAASGMMPTTLSDTRVLFDTTAAPVLYVSDTQVNAIVPYDVNGRFSTSVQIERFGVRSNTITLAVKDAQPGIFALEPGGRGQGAILNQDYSVNGTTTPALRGSVIQIFATGEGFTTPAGVNGKLIPSTELRKPVTTPVTVRIGGVNATVTYYGSAPNLVSGAFQVNAIVPKTIAAGAQPVDLQVGTAFSQANVTVAIK